MVKTAKVVGLEQTLSAGTAETRCNPRSLHPSSPVMLGPRQSDDVITAGKVIGPQ